jgi:hypothetical protein
MRFPPVVFLDVDGVLNTCGSSSSLGPAQLIALGQLVRASGAQIVLASDWRREPKLVDELASALREHGVDIASSTPQRRATADLRPVEIREWLDANGHDRRWVALDDRHLEEEVGGELMRGHAVLVNPQHGLTSAEVDEALRLLVPRRDSLRVKLLRPLSLLRERFSGVLGPRTVPRA